MAHSHASMLQEARFLKFRTAASFGKQYMKSRMKDSIVFGGAARRAFHQAPRTWKASRKKKDEFGWGGMTLQGRKMVQKQLDAQKERIGVMKATGSRLAPVVGGVMLGTAVAAKGYQYAKDIRRRANEKTQYRRYDVYPEHNYATVGIDPYNRPYYNDPNRAGAPRHSEARVGVYERDEIIDKIVEAVSQG